MEFIFTLFFWILVAQVFLFMFLNLPSPRGWKSVVIDFLRTNQWVKKAAKLHLGLCGLALLYYTDCYSTTKKLRKESDALKDGAHHHSDLRRSYLSYSVLRSQRNQYITFMLVYASVALNLYIGLMNKIYEVRRTQEENATQSKPVK